MKTVTITASKTYDILIGSGLLHRLGQEVKKLGKAEKCFIVSESTVWPLYGRQVEESLKNAGFEVRSFVFLAGEASKNGITYLTLLNELAQAKLTRSDILVALGGGVVGDLAGFAAATYLRGIRFVQVPTTLLAAVDSSVGGKTAIDLSAGKNLAGAFRQPSLVLCDIETLNTLPEDIFRDGCAEVIKYAVLYDPLLFSCLEKTGLDFDRETVIARCVELKRDVVKEDEFDTGARMKLNLGHTVGHAVEARSEFRLSHGKAVAIGMGIVCRAAGIPDCDRILNLIEQFGLPVNTEFTAGELYPLMLSDKKRAGSIVNLIIPKAIGDCEIVPTPVETLKSILEAGLYCVNTVKKNDGRELGTDITIFPGKLNGTVAAIPSKSQAHRLLICAALADAPTRLFCPETNRDIEATAECLSQLGAGVTRTKAGYEVTPIGVPTENPVLNCRDSGSTLRFLLPVVGALGCGAAFRMEGRLPQRPLSPLWEEMERMGCSLSRPTPDTITLAGQLKAGTYTIDGGISSQFITGLLLAAARIPGKSRIQLTGKVESRPYIAMTQEALKTFGLNCEDLTICGGAPSAPPAA